MHTNCLDGLHGVITNDARRQFGRLPFLLALEQRGKQRLNHHLMGEMGLRVLEEGDKQRLVGKQVQDRVRRGGYFGQNIECRL